MAETVTLAALHAANIARQAEWCPDQVPDLSFRGNELGGECGEAQNVIKKLERERQGWAGSRATKEQLAEELADVEICGDLCAVTAGIDLGAAVVAKFNATSEKVGLTTRLEPKAGASSGGEGERASEPPSAAEQAVVDRVEEGLRACPDSVRYAIRKEASDIVGLRRPRDRALEYDIMSALLRRHRQASKEGAR